MLSSIDSIDAVYLDLSTVFDTIDQFIILQNNIGNDKLENVRYTKCIGLSINNLNGTNTFHM